MFVWHHSERVHIIWAGVWLTIGSLICLTALAVNAPHDQLLLVVPVVIALAGPLLTVIGTLVKDRPPPDGNGQQRRITLP